MKSLLKIFSVVCLLGLITGCDPLKGTLNVTTAFKAIANDFNKCDGDPDQTCDPDDHKFTVAPGQYDVSFEVKSKKKAILEMEIRGKKATLVLAIPKGKTIPENGDLNLSSDESGQPFDLMSEIKTTSHNSEPQTGIESCTIEYQETICHQVGYPPRTECWTQTHTRPGRRRVEYYTKTTEKILVANIYPTGQTDKTNAQFRGARRDTETIYTYDSGCY